MGQVIIKDDEKIELKHLLIKARDCIDHLLDVVSKMDPPAPGDLPKYEFLLMEIYRVVGEGKHNHD